MQTLDLITGQPDVIPRFVPDPPHDDAAAYQALTVKEAIRRATARMRNPKFRSDAAIGCAEGLTTEMKLIIAPAADGRIIVKVLHRMHTQREMLYCAKRLPAPGADDVETWEGDRQ